MKQSAQPPDVPAGFCLRHVASGTSMCREKVWRSSTPWVPTRTQPATVSAPFRGSDWQHMIFWQRSECDDFVPWARLVSRHLLASTLSVYTKPLYSCCPWKWTLAVTRPGASVEDVLHH